MKIMKKFFVFLFLFYNSFVFGESIRGNMAGILILDESQELQSVSLYLDDLAGIDLDMENPFLEGIEIVLEIPQQLQNYRNSFAVYLYKNISPLPDLRESRYQGSQVLMHILPVQSILSIKIPLNPNHEIIKDATSVVSSVLTQDNLPFIVTMVPIMKGIPDQAYEVPLNIRINPIYSDLGGFRLILTGDEALFEQEIELLIDNQERSIDEELHSLSPGLHNIVLTTTYGGRKEFTITIEKGSIEELEYKLEALPAELHLPELPGVTYSLNNLPIDSFQQTLEPGIYLLKIQINPEWTIEEEILLNPGDKVHYGLELELRPFNP